MRAFGHQLLSVHIPARLVEARPTGPAVAEHGPLSEVGSLKHGLSDALRWDSALQTFIRTVRAEDLAARLLASFKAAQERDIKILQRALEKPDRRIWAGDLPGLFGVNCAALTRLAKAGYLKPCSQFSEDGYVLTVAGALRVFSEGASA
jgi:hypothetical protein